MIVYLHGFNSGGTSGKATWLRRELPDITVLSPTYPAHIAAEAPVFLRDYLSQQRRAHPHDKKLLLVGSSLGGFWARYLAREFGASMVLINPAMNPETDLLDAIGPNKNEATGDEYLLSEDQVKAFAHYQVATCDRRIPTLVLLDEADDVLDYRVAQTFYRDCGRVIVYPGGSHRFDHLPQALPHLRQLYESL